MSPVPLSLRLERLKRLLLDMGALVERQLADATRALSRGDARAARRAMALDADVSAFEARIDAACVALGGHHPPVADLRLVVAAMRMATELERIGDHAVEVARCALDGALPADLLDAGLAPMVELVRGMLAETLRALARSDAELARKVLPGSEAAAVRHEDAMRSMLAKASDAPGLLRAVFRLADAIGSLRRAARHAANVAEMVIYAAEERAPRLPGHREGLASRDCAARCIKIPAPAV
jgi:phosphate transport system protein